MQTGPKGKKAKREPPGTGLLSSSATNRPFQTRSGGPLVPILHLEIGEGNPCKPPNSFPPKNKLTRVGTVLFSRLYPNGGQIE